MREKPSSSILSSRFNFMTMVRKGREGEGREMNKGKGEGCKRDSMGGGYKREIGSTYLHVWVLLGQFCDRY